MAIALSVAYTATPTAAGVKLVIEATAQKPAGRNYANKSWYRLVMVTAAAAASPANILSAYNAKFGPLISGKKIFFRFSTVNAAGQRSAYLETSQIVT